MSDTFGIITGTKNASRPVCRVAYTLNNSQPVSCTIIGDQPLFYMDYDVDYEEEGLLESADIRVLENELRTLRNEIQSIDKFSEGFLQKPEQRFQHFLDNRDLITLPAAEKAQTPDPSALENILLQSRLGEAYIAFAKEHNVTIKLSGQASEAHYDRRSGTILINPDLEIAEQILLAARELRRHWQHRHGALIHPLMFHPDNAILVNRAQVADLVISMVRIAWELQLSGIKEPWERIENSSMADLGRAFAREAFLDFRTLNNGEASTAVFETWFLSERCRQEDKKLIQQMLADYQGYVFDLETAEQGVTPTLISALGAMPYGKNYLAGHAQTIMTDPVFTEVRDRSNANFLWFIKFERSFRETEQELQSSAGPTTGHGDRQATFQYQTKDSNNVSAQEKQGSAEVVELFPGTREKPQESGDKARKNKNLLAPKSVGKRKKNKTSAEIVYLRRWSGE